MESIIILSLPDPLSIMDDEENRVVFERQLMSIWKRKTQNCVLLNRAEYNAKLQRLLELENPQCPKNAQDFRLIKLYDYIVQDNGGQHQTRRLCKRGTSFLFVPIEEMYEILKSAHIQLRHAGRNSMQLFFRNKYCNITKDCIMTFLALCKQCPRKKKIREMRPKPDPGALDEIEMMNDEDDIDVDGTLHGSATTSSLGHFASLNGTSSSSSHGNGQWKSDKLHHHLGSGGGSASISATTNGSQFNDQFSRGQIDIIDMRKQPDGEYNYIFKYINLQSGEIRLKPMQYGTPMEAANMLIDIYCEQGAPVVLQSVNGRDFAKDIVMEISKLWPSCRQLHGLIRVSSFSDIADNGAIVEQLVTMQKRFNTNVWAHLLRFLQWDINSAYNSDISRSVLENTFGKQPQLGLPPSKLLEAVYDKAQSEEQMMDYIADAELLRLSAFCSNACQQAQQNQIIPTASSSSSSLSRHQQQQRPPISATASITVNPGHFIDESQLLGHQDTKPQPSVLSGQNDYHNMQQATISTTTTLQQQRSGSPAVFLDYRSLHMSVEQERQQQQQQQQHSAHHSVQHSPAPPQPPSQSQQPQQQAQVYLQQPPPQMEPPQQQQQQNQPPPQSQQPQNISQPASVYLQTSMEQQQQQQQTPQPQQSQPPQQQSQQMPQPTYVTTSLEMLQDMLDPNRQHKLEHDNSQQQQQQNHLSNPQNFAL